MFEKSDGTLFTARDILNVIVWNNCECIIYGEITPFCENF